MYSTNEVIDQLNLFIKYILGNKYKHFFYKTPALKRHLKKQYMYSTNEVIDQQYAKIILRKLKLDDALGSPVTSPDISRLNDDVLEVCRSLSDKGYVIGGSISLVLYGLASRPTMGDVDIFLSDEIIKKPFDDYEIINTSEYGDDEEKFTRFKIYTPQETRFKFDIFEKKVGYTVIDSIKFASPYQALNAKLRYWRLKDTEDFAFIARRFFNYDEFASKENEEFLLKQTPN